MTPLGWLSCTEKFSKCAKMGTGWSGLSVISWNASASARMNVSIVRRT